MNLLHDAQMIFSVEACRRWKRALEHEFSASLCLQHGSTVRSADTTPRGTNSLEHAVLCQQRSRDAVASDFFI